VKIGGAGGRAIASSEAEIDGWIAARLAEREPVDA